MRVCWTYFSILKHLILFLTWNQGQNILMILTFLPNLSVVFHIPLLGQGHVFIFTYCQVKVLFLISHIVRSRSCFISHIIARSRSCFILLIIAGTRSCFSRSRPCFIASTERKIASLIIYIDFYNSVLLTFLCNHEVEFKTFLINTNNTLINLDLS